MLWTTLYVRADAARGGWQGGHGGGTGACDTRQTQVGAGVGLGTKHRCLAHQEMPVVLVDALCVALT